MTTISVMSGVLIGQLIQAKMYKDIYSTKLYGINDDGTEKLIGLWINVEIKKSDLDSEYRNKLK